jgi:sugar/nucleoside kinase (ribokinase family)
MNEDEMAQFGPDPLAVAAEAMAAGVRLMVVTLGPRGAVYFSSAANEGGPIRTALIPAPRVDALDPTGCGDVFGAALCAGLLAGRDVENAVREANRLAARNASLRGAGGLGRLLQGRLATLGGPS